MKGLKVVSFLAALLAVGAMGFFLTNFIISSDKEEGSSIADQVKQSQPVSTDAVRENVTGTESELTKTNSEGAVAIKTTLLAEKSSKDQLVFEVVMNTHSVDLTQYDLTQLASISFGVDSNNSGVFEWDSANRDSHHMMGNLVWKGTLDNNYKTISLNLNNIDGISLRNFTWEKNKLIDEVLNN
jgi:hypothetical protein